MRTQLCLIGCLLLSAAGCDSDDASAHKTQPQASANTAKAEKAKVKWVGKRFSLEGMKARGTFSVPRPKDPKEGLMLRSYLYDFPDGTTANFGTAKGTVKGPAPLVLNTSFSSRLVGLSLKDVLRSQVDLKIKLGIKLPDGQSFNLDVPSQRISNAVAFELGRIEDGAVKFEGEKPATEPKLDTTAVVRVRSRTRQLRVVGDGKNLTDIDWIAIERDHGDRRTAECPRPGKPARKVRLQDTEVVLFERLTQKEIGRKVFPAKPNCDRASKTPRPRDLVDSWINKQMGRPDEPVKPQDEKEEKPVAGHGLAGATKMIRAAKPAKVAAPPKAPAPPKAAPPPPAPAQE